MTCAMFRRVHENGHVGRGRDATVGSVASYLKLAVPMKPELGAQANEPLGFSETVPSRTEPETRTRPAELALSRSTPGAPRTRCRPGRLTYEWALALGRAPARIVSASRWAALGSVVGGGERHL